MRSARSRFDDQLDSPLELVAGFVNVFMWFAFIGIVGLFGWSAVFGIGYMVRLAYKAVVR